MQGLNFVLPLKPLPYLLHVLGLSKFELISFAQAIIQYFILFTDYGFNLVATKEISLNRDNKQTRKELIVRLARKDAKSVELGLKKLFVPYYGQLLHLFKTTTANNGSEFSTLAE
jgi:IS30 family transposase